MKEITTGCEELYVEVPEGVLKPPELSRPGLRLIKAIYGLKQAGRVWNQTLDNKLRGMGFQSTRLEPCMYVNKEQPVYI